MERGIKQLFFAMVMAFILGGMLFINHSEVSAASKVWSGKVAKKFAVGEGTKKSPFLISSPEEFELMRSSPEEGAYYKLNADLFFNENTKEYKKWGTEAPKKVLHNYKMDKDECKGYYYFDGDGHTLYGIYLKNGSIFGNVSNVTIKNLTVRRFYVKDSACLGNDIANSDIKNVTLKNGIVYSKNERVGAIAETFRYGKISNCTVNVLVTAVDNGANQYIGGFSGLLQEATATHCENQGKVSIEVTKGTMDSKDIGGLFGQAFFGFYIDKCLNAGTVTYSGKDSDMNIGGLVGFADFGREEDVFKITNSVNTGTIASICVPGGIVGGIGLNMTDLFKKMKEKPLVKNCYNAGTLVSSNGSGGGICSCAYNTVIENCYNSGQFEKLGVYQNQIVSFPDDTVDVKNCYALVAEECRVGISDPNHFIPKGAIKRISSKGMKKKVKKIVAEAGNI